MRVTLRPVLPDRWVFVVLRCYVLLNSALLAVQIWTFTQRAYIRQETEDRIWFASVLLGMALLVCSFPLVRRRKRRLSLDLLSASQTSYWPYSGFWCLEE